MRSFAIELISQAFSRTYAQRGWTYFSDGYVQDLESKLDADGDLEISAWVRNDRGRHYRTVVYYQPENDDSLWGNCSCPMQGDCKHCAAVAYAWLAEPKPEPEASSESLDGWLQRFASLQASAPTSPRLSKPVEPLLYLLDLNAQAEATLTVKRARLRQDGHYSNLRRAQLKSLRGQRHPQLGEVTKLQRLLSLMQERLFWETPNQVEDLVLKGDMGLAALQLILASGHTHWRDPNTPPLHFGGERRLVLGWQSLSDQSQALQVQVVPPADLTLELGGQNFYLDLSQGLLGPLSSPLSPEQLHLLRAAPSIPEQDLARVYWELSQSLPRLESDKKEPASQTESAVAFPTTVLPRPEGLEYLEKHLQGPPHCHLILESGRDQWGQNFHWGRLEFEYAGFYTSAIQAEVDQVFFEEGTLYRLQRDLAAEREAGQILVQSGLSPLWNRADSYTLELELPESDADTQVVFEVAMAWYRWLSQVPPQLEEQGWRIHVADSFQLQILRSPSWTARLSEGESHEWFQLSLGIELNGEQVNLLPLFLQLLRMHPDPRRLEAKLAEQEHWLLPLGSVANTEEQRWLEVPAERLRSLFATLIELYDTTPLNAAGNLEFGLFAGLQLDTLLNDSGVEWQGAERLRTLLQKLQHFEGITPVPVPAGLQAELRPYQQLGLNWLQFLREYGFQGILADDMGLGKTLQTLAHLLVEKQAGRLATPALVVAPTSVLSNWKHEAQRFTPELKALILHGPERQEDFERISQYDLVITSYALIRRDDEVHQTQNYTWLILDEAQNIKNPRAKTSGLLFELPAEHRLCLSGTPMENHLEELWSLYRFLMPGFLGPLERFNRLFRHPIEREGDSARQAALRQRLRPFLLRRRKSEVETELPPKTEMIRYVSFENQQRDLYETIRVAMDQKVREEIKRKGLARSQIMILDALLKLRQVCCAPQLVKLPAARKVKTSAKLKLLMTLLPELLAEGRRVLIFSQFVQMLSLIEAELQGHKIDYAKLSGQTRKRDEVIQCFQSGEVPVFLISLKAGGVGLNLTAADTVIHYDPWWNPAVENQATDRAWRIGQDKPVFVYKLIVEGSVEEKILALQQRKAALTESMYASAEGGGLKLQGEELLALFEH